MVNQLFDEQRRVLIDHFDDHVRRLRDLMRRGDTGDPSDLKGGLRTPSNCAGMYASRKISWMTMRKTALLPSGFSCACRACNCLSSEAHAHLRHGVGESKCFASE